jgi:hypothetical protein
VADVDDLLTRLARGIVGGAREGVPLPVRLCRAAADVLGYDGGAITLAYTQPERVTLSATDDVALVLEEQQDVLGQGPGPQAFTTGAYTRLEISRPDDPPDPRWPLLESGELAGLAPVVAHAVPIEVEGQVVGVLTLHTSRAGDQLDLDDATTVARVLAAALAADAATQHDLGHGPWGERAEVHQATGMVVAQLGVPEDDALALIRAHAYSHDQSVTKSAHDVITRQLTFSATTHQEIEST